MLLSKPLLSREFVGREQEIEQLRYTWQHTSMGNPQCMLIYGEAGLGKTRLCRTFIQSDQTQHALRFWGRALPQDQAMPFAPFLDAFRRSFHILTNALKQLDQGEMASFAFLVQLLPELSAYVPGLGASTSNTVSFLVKRQQLFFHDILRVFHTLAQLHQEPIVFVLEDLHWADETSLELLSFLAHQSGSNNTQTEPSVPLLLLGTYRSEALPENPALQQMIWHLQAQRCITQLQLAPLSIIEHRQCIHSILDQQVPDHFADFLFTWDEGNPFYAEELLGAMAVTGQLQREAQHQTWVLPPDEKPHLPSSIKAAILESFMRLADSDQEVLTYASVIGRTFDFPLLATICKMHEHTIVKVLSRAIDRQLLSEVTNTHPPRPGENTSARYRFRHALIREAIYDRLHIAERRLYHRMVAETIEQISAIPSASVSAQSISTDQVAALLTKHYQLAGLLEQARPYALQEAQRASKLCAFHEERHYLDLAQTSLPEHSPERLALLERLGILSIGIFDFESAFHWLTLAQKGHEHLGQTLQVANVLTHMLLPQWFLARPSLPQLIAQLETEVEQLLASPAHVYQNVEVLTVTSHLALYWGSSGQLRRASHWVKINENLYRELDDPRKENVFKVSIISRGYIKTNQQAVLADEGIAEIRSVIRYAHQHSLLNTLMLAYLHMGIILVFRGDVDGAEQIFQEAIDYERRSGVLHPSFARGWHHFFSGQWDKGVALLQSNVETLRQANILMLSAVEGVILAHILLARNVFSEAQVHLQQAQKLFEPLQQESYLLWMEWGFAKLHATQGNQLQAQHWYDRTLKRWQTMEGVLLISPPILLDSIRFYVQNNNIAQAQQWIEILRNIVDQSGTPVSIAALAEAEGFMAAKQGILQPAIQKLKQAVEAWDTLKWRYRQAEASLQLAALLLTWAGRSAVKRQARQKAREDAEHLLESAENIYQQLQLSSSLEQVQKLRAHTKLDAQKKRRTTLAKQHSFYELTPKEMQVLALLATGKTNKEIAEQLCITSRTAELHVTHILMKLQCETRTQAVAKAIYEGLVAM